MEDPQLAISDHAAGEPPMPPLPQYMRGEDAGAVAALLTAGFMDAAAAAAMRASEAMMLASTLDEDVGC